MVRRLFFGTLVILAIWEGISFTAPEPAVVQGPGQWTLDIKFIQPQQIVLQRVSDNKPIVFWYIIISLNNNTGDEVSFFPDCVLMTDTFQVIKAGKDASPAVFNQIKERYKNSYRFLEDLNMAGTKILRGEDNIKDIAVIWPDFDTNAKNVQIFITGLSNETTAVDHPVAKDEQTGKPLKVFLRKTLELDYAVKPNPTSRTGVSLDYRGKRWIMR
jgi:hypothetical protein